MVDLAQTQAARAWADLGAWEAEKDAECRPLKEYTQELARRHRELREDAHDLRALLWEAYLDVARRYLETEAKWTGTGPLSADSYYETLKHRTV